MTRHFRDLWARPPGYVRAPRTKSKHKPDPKRNNRAAQAARWLLRGEPKGLEQIRKYWALSWAGAAIVFEIANTARVEGIDARELAGRLTGALPTRFPVWAPVGIVFFRHKTLKSGRWWRLRVHGPGIRDEGMLHTTRGAQKIARELGAKCVFVG